MMFRRAILSSAFVFGVGLAGCASPTGSTIATTGIALLGQQVDLETTLITELQTENRIMRLLSRNTDSCGDANDASLNATLGIQDPKKYVQSRFNANRAFVLALQAFTEYSQALDQIVERGAADEQTIGLLQGALKGLASLPGTPAGAGAVIDPASGLAVGVSRALRRGQIQQTARAMRPALVDAFNKLRRNFPTLAGQTQRIFDMWDNCAQEILRYARDLPNSDYLNASSGIELANAYTAYLARRTQLRPAEPQSVVAAFKRIIDENERLIAGTAETQRIDAKELAKLIQNAVDLGKALAKLD